MSVFLCAGEGGYEGVACLWLQAIYAAHSHTWQPRGTGQKIRNVTSPQPLSPPLSFSPPLSTLVPSSFTFVKSSPSVCRPKDDRRTLLAKNTRTGTRCVFAATYLIFFCTTLILPIFFQ